MRRFLLMVVACMGLAGCAHVGRSSTWVDPSMAVQLAAAAGPQRGVDGVFALTVRASGNADGRLYLNSQSDYRDPRNLSISIGPDALQELVAQYGSDPGAALKGRAILVRGTARLVRIGFVADGRRVSDKYYYQTHVRVDDATQLQLR